jgi:hypothetical protein
MKVWPIKPERDIDPLIPLFPIIGFNWIAFNRPSRSEDVQTLPLA